MSPHRAKAASAARGKARGSGRDPIASHLTQHRWLLPALLAVATLIAFVPALQNGFVNWDDHKNFVQNPHYRGLGWPQLRWMTTTFHMGHYIPLTWITLGLDYLLWGMNPVGYHLTSLLLHITNAVLFYLVALRLLRAAVPDAAASGPGLALGAMFAGLLFALHPLRVESVAWATERRDVRCGVFFLLTVLAYLEAVTTREPAYRRRWWIASVGLFGAALLSKAAAMPLPAVLLLLDVYPLRRIERVGWSRVLLEKVPYAALAAASAGVALAAQSTDGALNEAPGLAARLTMLAFSSVFYPWKFLWPAGLSPLYESPERLDPLAWRFLLPTLASVAVTVGLVLARRRWPVALAVWVYSVLIVLPVSGVVVHAGPQIAADRYSYLPGLGWALLGGAALWGWGFGWSWTKTGAQRAPALIGGMLVAIVVLGALTWRQSQVWRDSGTLWMHALSTHPSAIAAANVGILAAQRGEVSQAIAHYRQALAINGRNVGGSMAHTNLGVLLASRSQPGPAVEHFREALRIKPDDAEAHSNLGAALAQQGLFSEAVEHLRRALALKPDDPESHGNLGAALAQQARFDEAVEHFRHGLRLNPSDAKMHNNLGLALLSQGQHTEAAEHFRQVLAISPGFHAARRNLERVQARAHDRAGVPDR